MDADIDNTQIYSLDCSIKDLHQLIESASMKIYYTGVDHVMSNTRKPTYMMMHAETAVKTKTMGGRLEAALSITKGGKLYVGSDYYDLNKDGIRARDIVASGAHFLDIIWPGAHIKDLGIFSEFKQIITPKLISTFGMRVDRVGAIAKNPDTSFVNTVGLDLDRTEINISGNASLLYSPIRELDLSLFLGRGVKTANITERYIYLLPVGLDRYDYLGNPNLKPEENLQVEIGVNSEHSKGYLNVAAFYSKLSNCISAELDTSTASRNPGVLGVKRYCNIDEAMKIGGELLGGVKITERLMFKGILSYVFGENRDKKRPLPETPPFEGNIGIRYDDEIDRFWGEFSGRFVAKQDRISEEFGEQETPGFSVFDFRAGINLRKSIKLSFGVDNIFNETYHEHLNRRNKIDMNPIMEPGRNIYFVVDLGF